MFLRPQSPVAKFDPLLPTATYDLARICHLWPSMPHTEEGGGGVYFCATLDLIPVKMIEPQYTPEVARVHAQHAW